MGHLYKKMHIFLNNRATLGLVRSFKKLRAASNGRFRTASLLEFTEVKHAFDLTLLQFALLLHLFNPRSSLAHPSPHPRSLYQDLCCM